MIEHKIGGKVVRLVRGDITSIDVEAFVFDITSDCKLGSGYGGAIAQRGGREIQTALDAIGNLPTGQAALTPAGKLQAKHIVHANGPKFNEPDTAGKLRSATLSALRVAADHDLKQLALPPIGSGLYQVPLDLCARVMLDAVTEHLQGPTSLAEVIFVALDSRELKPLQKELAARQQKGA